MSSNDVFTCRWAILGTGFAATTFTQELYVERTEYAPAGIIHQVTAVCDESPASGTKLEDFVKVCGISLVASSHRQLRQNTNTELASGYRSRLARDLYFAGLAAQGHGIIVRYTVHQHSQHLTS